MSEYLLRSNDDHVFRLLSQCTEYFDLRCQLLDDLTSECPHYFTKKPLKVIYKR